MTGTESYVTESEADNYEALSRESWERATPRQRRIAKRAAKSWLDEHVTWIGTGPVSRLRAWWINRRKGQS